VFLTTHFLDEADQYAERVLVMDHGRMIADDTAAELKTRLAGDVITLGFRSEADAAAAAARAGGEQTGTTLIITADHGERLLPTLLRDLDGVTTATLRQPTLDDVFLALTGRSLREESASVDPAAQTPDATTPITEGAHA
jgi:ABC-2 type transport system ATP-binding protein